MKHKTYFYCFSFFCRMSVSLRCLCCVKYLMFVFNLIFWVSICMSLFQINLFIFAYSKAFPKEKKILCCLSQIKELRRVNTEIYKHVTSLIWDLLHSTRNIAFRALHYNECYITTLVWHYISLKARGMRFVWCWSVAVLHTGKDLLSPPVLPIPLSCQSATSCWWNYHGNWLSWLSWSP